MAIVNLSALQSWIVLNALLLIEAMRGLPAGSLWELGALCVLFLPIILFLQELAHFLLARLLGLVPEDTFFGSGRRSLGAINLADGTNIRFGLYPASFSMIDARSERWLRLRMGLLFLSRPIASVAAIMACFLFCSNEQLMTALHPSHYVNAPVLATFLMYNIVCIPFTLWPNSVRTPAGSFYKPFTNGAAFWRLFSVPTKALLPHSLLMVLLRAKRLLRQGRFEEALAFTTEALTAFPQSAMLYQVRGFALLESGQEKEAKEVLLQGLMLPEVSKEDRATLLIGLAWFDFITKQPDLKEATARMEEALELSPKNSSLQSTQGALFIRLGRIEEGIALTKRSSWGKWARRGRAYQRCCLALAEISRGALYDAAHLLDEARTFNPACILIAKVEAELKDAKDATRPAYR